MVEYFHIYMHYEIEFWCMSKNDPTVINRHILHWLHELQDKASTKPWSLWLRCCSSSCIISPRSSTLCVQQCEIIYTLQLLPLCFCTYCALSLKLISISIYLASTIDGPVKMMGTLQTLYHSSNFYNTAIYIITPVL